MDLRNYIFKTSFLRANPGLFFAYFRSSQTNIITI